MEGNERLGGGAVQVVSCANPGVSGVELLTPIRNVVHDAVAQGQDVLCDVSVGVNIGNEEFDQVNEKVDCLLGEANA